jgi:hypothetical protein
MEMKLEETKELIALIKETYSYDPETGIFSIYETVNKQNRRVKGFHLASHGYVTLAINRYKKMYAHRAAWAVYHGEWPKHCIDHINRDKTDNRIANLREMPKALNLQNKEKQSNNKTGYKGVYYCSRGLRHFKAQIGYGGKRYFLGSYSTPEEAYRVYCEAARKHHQFNPSADHYV